MTDCAERAMGSLSPLVKPLLPAKRSLPVKPWLLATQLLAGEFQPLVTRPVITSLLVMRCR